MRIFIAGGCGFIGLNLAEAWLSLNHEVVLFDRGPLHPEAAHAFDALGGRYHVVTGDVRDAAAIAKALTDHDITHAYYGAALTSGPERERDTPADVLGVNLMGFVNLLHAANARGVKRVINISSGAAYGPTRVGDGWSGDLVEDEAPANPDTLYGISKFASERVARRLAGLLPLDIISVRLAAIYGPWEIDSGARDTLSPQMQAALLAREGGTAVLSRRDHQDWTYSRHVGAALLALMQAPAPQHDLYHISCSHPWAVMDWCARLSAAYPAFTARLAAANETPTVELRGERDRLPMATARLTADTGYNVPTDIAADHADFLQWMADRGAFWDPRP